MWSQARWSLAARMLEGSLLWLLSTIVVVTRTSNLNVAVTVNPRPTPPGSAPWEVRAYTGLYTGPYFDTGPPSNVTSQFGTHAFLPCRIKQLGNKSVSWIRQRDSHILTVDRYTFIADDRFQVLHSGEDWTLQVKFVQERDAGVYECQVTSEPKLSLFVQLAVVVPQTEILGEPDVFVKSGSAVQIKCVITQNLEQPSYIFWYHDQERVNLVDGGKYSWVDRVNANTTIGTLVIKSTAPRDSGNYTCSPSNIQAASVTLHVLNGEHPAAMQQGSGGSRCQLSPAVAAVFSISVLASLQRILVFVSRKAAASASGQQFPSSPTPMPTPNYANGRSSFIGSIMTVISSVVVLCGWQWRGGPDQIRASLSYTHKLVR